MKLNNKLIRRGSLAFVFVLTFVQIFVFYSGTTYDPGGVTKLASTSQEPPPTFPPNTWIFNQHVAQYSTRTIRLESGDILIDVLAFIDYPKENRHAVKRRMKCVILNTSKWIVLNVRGLTYLETMIFGENGKKRRIWKIQCRLNANFLTTKLPSGNLRVALTDFDEYLELSSNSSDSNQLLSFHVSNYYDPAKTKRKSVAHCVHMVRQLTPLRFQRLNDWLHFQKSIGFERVRLYFAEAIPEYQRQLEARFGTEFVEFVDYRLDFEFICKFAIDLKNKTSNSLDNNNVTDYLYENCRRFHELFFDQSKPYLIRSHEKICTNDCLLNFKHQYEFGSN